MYKHQEKLLLAIHTIQTVEKRLLWKQLVLPINKVILSSYDDLASLSIIFRILNGSFSRAFNHEMYFPPLSHLSIQNA